MKVSFDRTYPLLTATKCSKTKLTTYLNENGKPLPVFLRAAAIGWILPVEVKAVEVMRAQILNGVIYE